MFSAFCLTLRARASPTKCEKANSPSRPPDNHQPFILLITENLESCFPTLKFWCDRCEEEEEKMFLFRGSLEMSLSSSSSFVRSLGRSSSCQWALLCARPNGSSGMQLGNLLSVSHIMWHVYDPNKFDDVNFLLPSIYKFIAAIISAFIFASPLALSHKTRLMPAERVCGKALRRPDRRRQFLKLN